MTECPVIMRLKSFPVQFGSLLICSFMVGPGQSQHEQAALLYLRLEVSEGEGIKTKCEEGREVCHASHQQISIPLSSHLQLVVWCH